MSFVLSWSSFAIGTSQLPNYAANIVKNVLLPNYLCYLPYEESDMHPGSKHYSSFRKSTHNLIFPSLLSNRSTGSAKSVKEGLLTPASSCLSICFGYPPIYPDQNETVANSTMFLLKHSRPLSQLLVKAPAQVHSKKSLSQLMPAVGCCFF